MTLKTIAFGAALLCLPFSLRAETTSRPQVPLNGEWQFRLDSKGEGEAQRWYEQAPKADGAIQVPGHWAAQGFGAETKEARHTAHGKGWYFRSVTIPPDFAGKRVFFRCGGVYRYLRLWVDGKLVEAPPQTYAERFAWDITPYIKPGQAQSFAMEVDSVRRPAEDPLMGAGYDFPEYIPIPFLGGGFSGHVWLEARATNWIDSVIVRTWHEPRVATVIAALNSPIPPSARIRFTLIGPSGNTIATQEVAQATAGNMPILFAQFDVPDAELWSLEKPTLQHCLVEIVDGGNVVDSVNERFGWREIRLEREKILLNGKRIMLRGESDGSNFPGQILPQPDKEFYRKLISAAKGLGFNASRHHSHALPEEYLEVCDELGFLATYELPVAYEQYYRKAETEFPATLAVYERVWRNMIERFRNHPSVFSWGMGNELYGYPAWNYPQTKRWIFPAAAQLYAVAKDLDPDRPVIDSDGIHMLGVAPPDPAVQFSSGVLDRGTLDYFVQFISVNDLPLAENPRRYELAPFPVKPSISHEDVNHFTFPRFRRMFDGYDGAVKMHWFQEAMQKLEERGLLEESEKWAESSERLYGAGAKMAIETLRLNPGWSGYHFWQIVDFWNATDGLFDIRMQRKPFPTDAEVLRWNSPVAVLQKGFPTTNVLAGAEANVRIFGSNFDPQEWATGRLAWKLLSGGQTLASGDAATAALKQGDVTLLTELKIGFPSVTKPTPVRFQVALSTASGRAENEWTCWIYPASAPKPSLPAPVFAEELLLPMLASVGAKPIPTGANALPTQAIYVTSKATPDVLTAVEGGAGLLLLSPTSGVPSQARRWGGGWWDGSVAGMENGGTMTYGNTPLTRELAPEGWCDAGWYPLLDGSRTYPLDTWPVKPRLLIRNIDTWQRLADLATLSEFAVGKGRVVLSGLVFDPAKWNMPEPSRAWAITRLLEAVAAPTDGLPVLPRDFLLKDFIGVPKGPLLAGVDPATVDGGEEAALRTWHAESEPLRFCRLNAASPPVTWRTLALLGKLDDRVNLVFAGAMGFASQPAGKFVLSVNGKKTLRFESSIQRAEWTQVRDTTNFVGEPRLANLRWFPLWTNDQDASGIFVLTLPSELLKPGQAAELTIQGDGSASLRWLAIDPYPNAAEDAAKIQ